MFVFIGMETSGASRRAFQAKGHQVYSCDLLPADDGETTWHIQGDVFATLKWYIDNGHTPDLAIFHPTCTYLTNAASWALSDGPYGPYRKNLRPDVLLGAARRAARADALNDVRRLLAMPIDRIALENPVGAISTEVRKPDQIINPYDHGHDIAKKTCLWLKNLPLLKRTNYIAPTLRANGKLRWGNQTDEGNNRIAKVGSADEWKLRSETYQGIADAFAEQWGGQV